MKIENVPGEFAFKALIKWKRDASSWGISTDFFFSKEEVEIYYNPEEWDIKFPIEVLDNGSIYCPAKEELE